LVYREFLRDESFERIQRGISGAKVNPGLSVSDIYIAVLGDVIVVDVRSGGSCSDPLPPSEIGRACWCEDHRGQIHAPVEIMMSVAGAGMLIANEHEKLFFQTGG
jgi:hypothetical protein